MKILITGCMGQLGRELQARLAHEPDIHVTATDIDTLDLTLPDEVRGFVRALSPDWIVNCAAYTAVDRAEEQPDLCRQINAVVPATIARAAEGTRARIVHISTDYIFNGQGHRPYREADVTAPASVYGRTKLEGEIVLQELAPESVIIRTAWLYSPHGNNFVKTMIRLGHQRRELGVVTDQIGTPTNAADLAEAIVRCIRCDVPGGVYHFTDEGVASWFDFAHAIFEMAGISDCRLSPLMTEQYPTPARRPAYSVLDKSKIKQATGMAIPHWRDSLRKLLLSNPQLLKV